MRRCSRTAPGPVSLNLYLTVLRSSAVALRRIARELQDWRFESDTLTSTAEIRLRAQQNGEARAALETALDIARRTGMAHCGSITLADRARTETRSKIIDEIEELLSTVAVSHNHWFERRQLIELGWELRDRRDERVVSRLSPRARLPFQLARSRLARTLAPNLHRRKDLGHGRRSRGREDGFRGRGGAWRPKNDSWPSLSQRTASTWALATPPGEATLEADNSGRGLLFSHDRAPSRVDRAPARRSHVGRRPHHRRGDGQALARTATPSRQFPQTSAIKGLWRLFHS